MLALVNVVRKAGFQPETLRRSANQKFERRFRQVDTALATQPTPVSVAPLAQKNAAREQVKQSERAGSD